MKKVDQDRFDDGGACHFATVRQIADDPAWPFSEGSLRYLLFNAQYNGLDKAIKRIGKKVLIHKPRFLAWLESQPDNSIGRKS